MKDCPTYVLEPGTKIITDQVLGTTAGMMVRSDYLAARKPATKAVLGTYVGGHGGDVYWAKHEDGTVSVYCWTEFELDQ